MIKARLAGKIEALRLVEGLMEKRGPFFYDAILSTVRRWKTTADRDLKDACAHRRRS